MGYEYQHKIKSDLKFFDESGTISNVYKLGEKLVELDEVYRKAEAFDDYMKHNLSYGKTYYEITREHIADEMKITLEKYESEEDSQ